MTRPDRYRTRRHLTATGAVIWIGVLAALAMLMTSCSAFDDSAAALDGPGVDEAFEAVAEDHQTAALHETAEALGLLTHQVGQMSAQLRALRLATEVEPPPGWVLAAAQCREDEAFAAIDYRDPAGIEDAHGVSRACQALDDIGAGR